MNCLFFPDGIVQAQDTSNGSQSSTTPKAANGTLRVSQTDIDSIKQELEAQADLDPELAKKIEGLVTQATEDLARVKSLEEQTASFKQSTENLSQRLATLKDRKAELANSKATVAEFETLPEAEQALSQKQLELVELKAELTRIEAEPAARTVRRKEIQTAIANNDKRLADLKQGLETEPPEDENPLLTKARRAEIRTSIQAVEAELLALRSEVAFYDAEEAAGVMILERDVRSEEVARAQTEVNKLQADVERRRMTASEQFLEEARSEVVKAPVQLKNLAEENVAIAQLSHELTGPIQQEMARLDRVTLRLEGVQQELAETKQRVQSIGSTYAVGNRLRRQRVTLPNVQSIRRNIYARQSVIEEAQEQWFNLDDQRADLSNLDRAVKSYFKNLKPRLSGEDEKKLEEATRELLERQREILDQALRNYDTYLQTLSNVDNKQQLLLQETKAYQEFIDERVLWVRSNKPLYANLVADSSDMWIFNADTYTEIAGRIAEDFRNHPIIYVMVIGFAVYWLLRKPTMKDELESLGKAAQRGTCTELEPTIRAIVLTLFMATPIPLLIVCFALRLNAIADDTTTMSSVAFSLTGIAWAIFPLEFLRIACRRRGLVDAHFEWDSSIIMHIRQKSRWFLILGMPLALVNMELLASEEEYGHDLIERGCYCAAAILLAIFLQRILRPLLIESRAFQTNGWSRYLLPMVYWIAIGLPVLFAGLAITGYYYTALHLTWRLYNSLIAVLVVLFLHGILVRMVLLQRRRLFIERHKSEMESVEAIDAMSPDKASPRAQEFIREEERKLDMAASAQQSQRLIVSGLFALLIFSLWLIWADVLPALRVLDNWKLWSITVTESYESPTVDGEVLTQDVIRNITFANLALSLLIAFFTIVAATNIPGLMEIALLQRLPIDQSVRYAITRISSYMIVLVGIILTFNAVAIGWSQVQWLATALTFGLAFGLQEIFANFVAGIILLFERPLRVGDVVTVDGVSGVVSRIRIRATTITNWDRQEYIIPNKEFITGRMFNWTLSDKINRILINVGIAYGSDTNKAVEILTKVCKEHPRILDEPQTLITFEGFGDNTLNFVVRTYLPDLDNRLAVVHELHTNIDNEFRKANIEIAFPQRDLHIRSVDPDAQKIFQTPAVPVTGNSREPETGDPD